MRLTLPIPHRTFILAGALAFAGLCPLGAQPVTTVLNGQAFVNHGLVGVGRLPHDQKDKFGETFGSFSAFAIEPGTWKRNADGSYAGTLFTQPDRGYNVTATTNYTPRFNKLTFRFSPSPTGGTAQNQLALTLADTIKYTESDGTPLTSLDPTGSGSGSRTGIAASLPQAFNNRLSLDAEGMVINPDGSLWISDEYGPYVYKFTAEGKLQAVIRPPEAIVPKRAGADSFASNNPGVGQPVPAPADPVSGRQNNQGLEGLSVSPDGRTLFALLQSSARQEGGTGGSSAIRFNTRLLAYDLTTATPTLKGEYVLQLPTYLQGSATRVAAQSEILALNSTQFLVLVRDSGNGRGLVPTSVYRKVVVYDISGATNIAGTAFDNATGTIATGGVLDASIKPAARADLIDLNDAAQLTKFGLHNGPTDDTNNLSEKWEALALAPAMDPSAPNDWFLFVGNDNDFLTTNGFQDGAAYAAAVDNDSMILVYRVTIPSRLVNVSSRAQAGAGSATHIVGFVVNGARPKTMLVRGVGPTLASYGLTDGLSDPMLAIYDSAGRKLFTNDNWSDNNAASVVTAAGQRTGAFALNANSKDAALLVDLDPGAYTAQVTGVGSATGISLVEVYELP